MASCSTPPSSSQGEKFTLAVALSGSDGICGVAIVGHPVSRHLDNGRTLEDSRYGHHVLSSPSHERLSSSGAPASAAADRSMGAPWGEAWNLSHLAIFAGETQLFAVTRPDRDDEAAALIRIRQEPIGLFCDHQAHKASRKQHPVAV